MPKISGVNHLKAVKALEKAGFRIARQGKHYCNDRRRKNRNDSAPQSGECFYNGGIVKDTGLTEEEFRKLL